MNLNLMVILECLVKNGKVSKENICFKIGGYTCESIKNCNNCSLSRRLYSEYPDENIITQLTKVMEHLL